MKYPKNLVLRSSCLALIGVALVGGSVVVGCSSADDTDGDSSGDGDGDMGGAPGDGDDAKSWVVGGWVETTDAWYGVLGVVDDLSSKNTLDLDDVVSFDADFTYTGYGGAIYVGNQGKPTIEKWVVNKGKLKKDDELNLSALGVTETHGASHNVIQVIDANTAWFFDHPNGRAIIFNPSDMSTAGDTIDYSEIYDGLNLESDWPDIGDIGRVGDHIAVPMFWYDGDDDTIPVETRIALISTKNENVEIATDKRCAGSSIMSNDSEGNLYIGPHAAAALYSAAGDAGDAVPCVIRILKGETSVDQDYLLEFNDLSDDKAVGGLYQGPGNLAFVFQFEGDPAEGAKARFEDQWKLYSLELGSEDPDYTAVSGWPDGNGTAVAFSVEVGTEMKYYLTSTTEYGAKSAYYELLADGSVEKALNIPTYPGPAVNY